MKPKKLAIPSVLAVVTFATGASLAGLGALAGCSDDDPPKPVDAAIDGTPFCSTFCIMSDAGVCPTETDGSIICADDHDGMCPPSCRPVG